MKYLILFICSFLQVTSTYALQQQILDCTLYLPYADGGYQVTSGTIKIENGSGSLEAWGPEQKSEQNLMVVQSSTGEIELTRAVPSGRKTEWRVLLTPQSNGNYKYDFGTKEGFRQDFCHTRN